MKSDLQKLHCSSKKCLRLFPSAIKDISVRQMQRHGDLFVPHSLIVSFLLRHHTCKQTMTQDTKDEGQQCMHNAAQAHTNPLSVLFA